MIITLHYRLKDSVSRKILIRMSSAVNLVWNYCNEQSYNQLKKYSKWASEYELDNQTAGCAGELGLNSTTVQSICKEYITRRKQYKKQKLRWRSYKCVLGWIPFKASALRFKNNLFIYCKHKFKFFDSHYNAINLSEADIRTGSFNQDSKGNWFINLQVEIGKVSQLVEFKTQVGVDLGLKSIATSSDSISYSNEKFYYKSQARLATAQRAKHKNQTKSIHARIKNQRKDYLHKLTTNLINSYDLIIVGDLHLKACKSTLDAGISMVLNFLSYKAIKLGKVVRIVNEAWTTQRCGGCAALTGPKGLSGLSVRDWVCSECGASHNRDVNAAQNILRLGLGHQTLRLGIPSV